MSFSQTSTFRTQPKNRPFCFPIAVINAHIWAGDYDNPSLSELVHKGRSVKTGTADEQSILQASNLKWSHRVSLNLVAGNHGIAVFNNDTLYHASFIYSEDNKSYITNPQFVDKKVVLFRNIPFKLSQNGYGYLLFEGE